MRKFLNAPEKFVDEMVQGVLLAHPGLLKSVREDNRALVRASSPKEGKVAIITGGGSGHLPLFLGYVGEGLLDGVAIGGVFQSPSPQQILDAMKGVHGGAGVLNLYGNYGGDIMNFDMASELADMEDIRVETVIGTDDVASGPKGEESKRRGVAGMFFCYKTASAKAELGGDLDEVKRVAEKTNGLVRTMGVALSPCTLPEVGKPTFSIEEGQMELGMGIHGEPGLERGPIEPADRVAELLLSGILNDAPVEPGTEVSVLVNGLGATPLEELYIVYRRVHQMLAERGIAVHRPYVGEFATSLEMAGLSVSVLPLDDELKLLVDHRMRTPFHVQTG